MTTPTGYATSLRPGKAWAMAWVYPNPDQYIVEHVISGTRSETWDKVLAIWYDNHNEDRLIYWNYNEYARKGFTWSRKSAMHRLHRKGIRVVRVQVVAL